MITLFRWILLQQKRIKWELAFWQLIDKTIRESQKDPEYITKLLMPYIEQGVLNKIKNTKEDSE